MLMRADQYSEVIQDDSLCRDAVSGTLWSSFEEKVACMIQLMAADRRTGANSDWIYGEPGIDDMLRDPLLLLVLRRDDLSKDDLVAALGVGRRRLKSAGVKSSQAA